MSCSVRDLTVKGACGWSLWDYGRHRGMWRQDRPCWRALSCLPPQC